LQNAIDADRVIIQKISTMTEAEKRLSLRGKFLLGGDLDKARIRLDLNIQKQEALNQYNQQLQQFETQWGYDEQYPNFILTSPSLIRSHPTRRYNRLQYSGSSINRMVLNQPKRFLGFTNT